MKPSDVYLMSIHCDYTAFDWRDKILDYIDCFSSYEFYVFEMTSDEIKTQKMSGIA